MNIDGDEFKRRNKKINEFLKKMPNEIESAVLISFNDIYSHSGVGKKKKKNDSLITRESYVRTVK